MINGYFYLSQSPRRHWAKTGFTWFGGFFFSVLSGYNDTLVKESLKIYMGSPMGIISLLIFPKSPSHCFQCEDIGNPAKRDFKRFLMSVSNLFSSTLWARAIMRERARVMTVMGKPPALQAWRHTISRCNQDWLSGGVNTRSLRWTQFKRWCLRNNLLDYLSNWFYFF